MSCLTWPLRHNYLKCPLFEGTSQPRSLGALTRDVPMANTPTLASFVELASQNCFLFSSPTKSPLQPSLQKTNLMPATQLRWLGHSIASTATATSRPLSLVELALDVAMANTPTSASFVNRVVFDAGAFAKHSQRVLSQQPAATLLYQLHYVPEKPATFSFAELQRGLPSTSARFTGEDAFEQQAGFSWTGDDVFKQLEERRATLLLGQSLIITGQIYCELCPADELPSWLPLEDY